MTACDATDIHAPDLAALFKRLAEAVREAVDLTPTSLSFVLEASSPAGPAPSAPSDWPDDLRAHMTAAVIPALLALDAAMPLLHQPEASLWETLRLNLHGHSGYAFLEIYNLLGQREHVQTWHIKVAARAITDWAACRTETEERGTTWDIARRERRVAWLAREGMHGLIEPGVNRVCDIAQAIGAEAYTSCEGHPWGAYVGFNRSDAYKQMVPVFRALGWTIEGDVVRMPETVLTVAARDQEWRRACSALEEAFGL